MKFFKKKIIIKISGGLGNQMFQYAFGRSIAFNEKAKLWLDVSSFSNDHLYNREFLLDKFNIKADRILSDPWDEHKSKIIRKINRNIFNKEIIHEPLSKDDYHLSHQQYLKGEPINIYNSDCTKETHVTYAIYDGYWQSSEYFSNISDLIINDFTINNLYAWDNYPHFNDICNTNSVCIGIRQYTDSEASKDHFKLDKEYYNKAMGIIEKKIKDPSYFIFTLEEDWARVNISSDYPITFIEPHRENSDALIDLYLISKCKHFIIANSTYHWWGAWLSEEKNKIVIAPEKGWGNSRAVPNSWIAL